jgi:hypothetical protein
MVSAGRSPANKHCRQELAECTVALTDTALAKEQCRNEVVKRTAMLTTRLLVDEQCHHEADKRAMALAVKATADNKEAPKCATVLAVKAFADDKDVAIRAWESTAATRAAQTLAENKWHHVDADAAQCQVVADHATALVEPPLGSAEIERICMEFALCAAPFDATFTDISWEDTTHNALAPPMTPLAHPTAMLSSPPLPFALCGCGPCCCGGDS